MAGLSQPTASDIEALKRRQFGRDARFKRLFEAQNRELYDLGLPVEGPFNKYKDQYLNLELYLKDLQEKGRPAHEDPLFGYENRGLLQLAIQKQKQQLGISNDRDLATWPESVGYPYVPASIEADLIERMGPYGRSAIDMSRVTVRPYEVKGRGGEYQVPVERHMQHYPSLIMGRAPEEYGKWVAKSREQSTGIGLKGLDTWMRTNPIGREYALGIYKRRAEDAMRELPEGESLDPTLQKHLDKANLLERQTLERGIGTTRIPMTKPYDPAGDEIVMYKQASLPSLAHEFRHRYVSQQGEFPRVNLLESTVIPSPHHAGRFDEEERWNRKFGAWRASTPHEWGRAVGQWQITLGGSEKISPIQAEKSLKKHLSGGRKSFIQAEVDAVKKHGYTVPRRGLFSFNDAKQESSKTADARELSRQEPMTDAEWRSLLYKAWGRQAYELAESKLLEGGSEKDKKEWERLYGLVYADYLKRNKGVRHMSFEESKKQHEHKYGLSP